MWEALPTGTHAAVPVSKLRLGMPWTFWIKGLALGDGFLVEQPVSLQVLKDWR